MPKRKLDDLARVRLGLLLGPGYAASRPKHLAELTQHLCAHFGLSADAPLAAGERALHTGVSATEIRRVTAAWIAASRPSEVRLRELAKLRYNAVISLCPEPLFEQLLQGFQRGNAVSRDVIVLDEPGAIGRPRTLPVFKLLGSLTSDNLIVSETELAQRAAQWASHMFAFVDAVQAGPILALGLDQVETNILRQVLSGLFFSSRTRPSGLVVAEVELQNLDPAISHVLPPDALWWVDGTPIEIARQLQPAAGRAQIALSFTAKAGAVTPLDLTAFADLLSVVPPTPVLPETERDTLLDHLFMPDQPNWDAHHHGLDFPRSLVSEVLELLAQPTDTWRTLHIHGRAASGKSTVLKRIATDSRKSGRLVLWLHHYVHDDIADRLKHLFRTVLEHNVEARILLVADHIAAMRTSPEEIHRLAHQIGLRIDLLVATRSSAQLHLEAPGSRVVMELPDELDADEWAQLPRYFTSLGAYTNEHDARRDLAGIPENTRDTLALLFWLLPGTQRRIRDAVREEYFALGQLRSVRDGLQRLLGVTPDVLKRAYALVAVASKVEVPVPVEVLVRSLHIGFMEWVEAVRGHDGPAWGLFYEDADSEDGGVRYRTRNEVVTSIIVEAVNGGAYASEGELGCLEQLLSACVGTAPVYETFCLDVLVPAKSLPDYKLEDGLRLYEAAERALPYTHRTIVHHKALWLRRKGASYRDIERELQRALSTPDAPLGGGESVPFIHNSYAAAIVAAIASGEMPVEEGTRAATRELENARSVTFVNAHAVHVSAQLTVELIRSQRQDAALDRALLAVRALADVERLLLLGTQSNRALNRELFTKARDDLLEATVAHWHNGEAERLFREHSSQAGLVCAVRNIARAAPHGSPGAALRSAYTKWKEYETLVADVGMAPELAEVGALIYYQWQVRPRSRAKKAASTLSMDWSTLQRSANRALAGERFKDDPFIWYLYGLASFHLAAYGDAQRAFEHNRLTRMHHGDQRALRDYLLTQDGSLARVQATNRTKAAGTSMRVEVAKGYGAVRVLESDGWPKGSAVVPCYVVFSFEGPLATLSEKKLLFS